MNRFTIYKIYRNLKKTGLDEFYRYRELICDDFELFDTLNTFRHIRDDGNRPEMPYRSKSNRKMNQTKDPFGDA